MQPVIHEKNAYHATQEKTVVRSKKAQVLAQSVEGLQLVSLHRSLVLVQVCQRVLCAVVVGIVVRIDGLSLKTSNGVKFFDRGGTQASESPEDSTLDFGNLGVLHSVDQGVLCLCCVILQLFGGVLLTKGCNLIEVHFEVVCHLFRKLILRCLQCSSTNQEQCDKAEHGWTLMLLDYAKLTCEEATLGAV